ncbi:MAG: ABC transporter ATP-binding protein/permease [Chthoniobacterales bacterium]
MAETPPAAPTSRLSILRRFAQLAKAFFFGSRRETRLLVAVLLLLCVAVGVVQVLVSYAGRNFMTSLAQRDMQGFYHNMWIYVGTFVLAVPIGVFYQYITQRLALLWRQWMTHLLVKRYFFNRAYYRLQSSTNVDNPDQRISEDVRSFTSGVLGYLLTLINSGVTLVAFIGVLWTISIKLPLVLFLYAGIGTLLSILIGRRLVGLHFKQYQKEADFRYGLIRVREYAESIAFFRGEKREHRDLIHRFAEVVKNTYLIIAWNRTLAFFTQGYNYIALVVPLLIVGPMFIRGNVEFGVVTQAAGAFASVLAALSVIVAQFEGLSAFAAGIKRLGELWDELDEFDSEDAAVESEAQIAVDETASRLKLSNLTVQTPHNGKTLTADLNFVLPPGKSALVMGESGAGKSSLLRTIAGLWLSGEGSIERPNLNYLMFLPQRPYMVQGSLRSQLLYPQNDADASEENIRDVLEKVNLSEMLERVEGDLDRSVDWANILSLGEQQRVSFARLFLRYPKLAFLDEATSALDEPNELLLYNQLRKLCISYVSVGHRSTLKAFHDYLIVLTKDGNVKVTELDQQKPPEAMAQSDKS